MMVTVFKTRVIVVLVSYERERDSYCFLFFLIVDSYDMGLINKRYLLHFYQKGSVLFELF